MRRALLCLLLAAVPLAACAAGTHDNIEF